MRKIFIFTILLLMIFPAYGAAKSRGFGAGLIVGEPTGLSLKIWLDEKNAFDAAAAWSFVDHEAVQFHVDYVWHNTRFTAHNVPMYYGVGGRFKFSSTDSHKHHDETRAGVRFPFGISYLFQETPFDIFFEIAPVLDLSPATDVSFNAAFGGRFYFGR